MRKTPWIRDDVSLNVTWKLNLVHLNDAIKQQCTVLATINFWHQRLICSVCLEFYTTKEYFYKILKLHQCSFTLWKKIQVIICTQWLGQVNPSSPLCRHWYDIRFLLYAFQTLPIRKKKSLIWMKYQWYFSWLRYWIAG